MLTIIENAAFKAQVGIYIQAEEKDQLFDFLARHPNVGDEIPGTGGIRKLRWSGKGKGKRGGLRVIYYFYNDRAPLFLLTIYGKGVQEDLTSKQKILLTKMAKELKQLCKQAGKKHA